MHWSWQEVTVGVCRRDENLSRIGFGCGKGGNDPRVMKPGEWGLGAPLTEAREAERWEEAAKTFLFAAPPRTSR